MKRLWNWLGADENHNASMVLITGVAVIFAFPYFSTQINHIEVKVDSLQESIKDLYGHYLKETYCSELLDSFSKNNNGETIIQIKLKHHAVPNSVNVWEGAMSVAPAYFTVDGDYVNVETNFSKDSFKGACTDPEFYYVVTYIPSDI